MVQKKKKKKKKKTPSVRSSIFRIGMSGYWVVVVWGHNCCLIVIGLMDDCIICLETKCLLTVSFQLMTAPVTFKKCINKYKCV